MRIKRFLLPFTFGLATSMFVVAATLGLTQEPEITPEEEEDEVEAIGATKTDPVSRAFYQGKPYSCFDTRLARILEKPHIPPNLFALPLSEAWFDFMRELEADLAQHPAADEEEKLIFKVKEHMSYYLQEKTSPSST